MLKAYSQFHLLGDESRTRAWLGRIMHNTWISNYRRLQRRPIEQLTADISHVQHEAHGRLHDFAGSRAADFALVEALPDRKVIEALEALPESFRMTIYYADVQGYRYREIAEILDIPIGTVMSRLHSARRTLRQLLVDVAHDHRLTL